ncbi:MAG TPA: hypothetical protein VFA45_03300 [Actinomycetes bacterium]|jgi:hypothetical protein|nr:hypothetical protein [Actinomycetes bacterium]
MDGRTSYDGWLYVGAASLLWLAGPLGCSGVILALARVRSASF